MAKPRLSYEIQIGDIVYLGAGGFVVSANVREEEDVFLGCAMQRSKPGEDTKIRVATSGVFQFDCEQDEHIIGEQVAPVPGKNQEVEKTSRGSIGRSVEMGYSSSVKVAILSTCMGR